MNTYDNLDELFNKLIKINSEKSKDVNISNFPLPISNNYYISILNDQDIKINNFFSYINDVNREIDYPFKRDVEIDYSFMIEQEQFYQIDLKKSNLSEILNNINSFFEIVSESDGNISLIIDIEFLLDFLIESKNKLCPNHFYDFIIWKLQKKITNILILDKNNFIKNDKNMLYYQLETCLKDFNVSKYNLDKNIKFYRKTKDTVIETIYWNIFYPESKIIKLIKKINSPFDNTEFDVVEISNTEYFLTTINLLDIIDKNIFNLHIEPGIIIDPIDRINVII